jgi:hypothetical protein
MHVATLGVGSRTFGGRAIVFENEFPPFRIMR